MTDNLLVVNYKLQVVCMDCGKVMHTKDHLSDEAVDRLFGKMDRQGGDALTFNNPTGTFISESICDDCFTPADREEYEY
jgi:hypothetical protein